MSSGLVLARGADTRDDGFLEAREILELEWQADLVVLSACDTARGGLRTGEGVLGLSWALCGAGNKSSVLTLWKVPDEGSADLMAEFYRRIHRGLGSQTPALNLAEALRQTQLSLLRRSSWSHPYHWAGFVLIGDWR